MKTVRTLVAAAALCVVGTAPALAQSSALTNPNFDHGLASWDAFGDVTVLGSARRAVLSTASVAHDDDGLRPGFNNNSGNAPVDFAFVPNLAGVPLSSLDNPVNGFVTEGSAIRQTFHATAGDFVNVSFDWAFLSMDSVPNDFAFVAVNDTVVRFADANSTGSRFDGTFGDFSVVNWSWTSNSFRYTASTSGIQSLVLGVVDTGDYNLTSELRVDNIAMHITPVPEPETYAMLLAGLALMGSIARRRRS
ncbi:MAG: hypothetical protein C0443_08225 [Comamonadaceae bacterium]|nr:hypothetical protein [Comamonadaceae bacterium]